MTRLSLWLGVGCGVLLVTGGIGFAPAAETESAAATEDEARLTLADVEVRKAEVRVSRAKAALAQAEARVDAGTADSGTVRAAERELAEAQLALMETRLRAQEWESQRVSLDVKQAALDDALRLLFKDTPYSYVLSPEIGRLSLDPLTISLKEVDLQTAVRVICDTYDLLYRKEDSIYYFFPRSDVVTVGGRTVPVLGTLEVPHGAELIFSRSPGPGEASRSTIIRTSPSSTEVREHDLQLGPSTTERPIDLHLDNVPIREAMARLAEAADMEIVVHEAVPEDIRITAKVYRVSAYRLLHEIADQAGLTVAQERVTEVTDEDGHVTRIDPRLDEARLASGEWVKKREFSIFYVVPKPELSVSGTGVGRHYWEARRGFRGEVESRVADVLREWQAEDGGSFMAVPFPSCPDCQQLIMGPDWQFCPRCGTKLPCEEGAGETGK